MKKHARHLVAGSVVAAVSGALIVTLVPGSSAASTSLTQAQITGIALGFAANAGDPTPTLVEHVETTRSQAVEASSADTVQNNAASYLIAMRGNFVLQDAPRPPGAAAPTGSVLTLVIDAQTGQLTDIGVQDNVPDLSQLGPVTIDG
jgi:hypothetical protein